MKLKIVYLFIILLSTIKIYGQQSICADSSFRLQYIFDTDGAVLYINSDTAGNNYFTGFTRGQLTGSYTSGLAIMKTNWGSNVIWAKKAIMNASSLNSYFSSDGTIICTGNYGGPQSNNPELFICRIDTAGNMLWAKRYRLTNNHKYFRQGNQTTKNLIITNNAIYAIASFLDISNAYVHVVVKLGLDGSILWSKSFNKLLTGFSSNQVPAFANNKLYFFGREGLTPTSIGITTITSLNDADGSIDESFSYRPIAADTTIKAILPEEIRLNADNSFSLIGLIGSQYQGAPLVTNTFFTTKLDFSLIPQRSFYYTNTIPLNIQNCFYDVNRVGQKAIIISNIWNLNEKYFINFNQEDDVFRSRKFTIPGVSSSASNSVQLDTKQNLHYVYQYLQGGKFVNEYARISNLSPNSTVGCFGKDTSILTRYPFTLVKTPYVWSNVQNDVLSANDVPFVVQDATVTKEVICKLVSYCDSLKITGPASVCVNTPVRYTVKRNSTCQKFTEWRIDTAFANIITMEADSAITLTFKKAFNGYLHAALSDCVVKDSIFIKAVTPVAKTLLPRQDSLLCPGKTLTLTAATGFTNYVWGGIAGQSININSIGKYVVSALDSCNNTVKDSITVLLADTALAITLSQTICLYDSAYITVPNGFSNITWQPTITSLLRNNTIVAYPAATTLYTITAQRQPNCPISRFSLVTVKPCPQTFFMPNSFTPNNDGLNDKFKPTISQPLAAYRFTIYNRYGQTIFTTTNQNLGWNGTFKNSQQPMGGYIYTCTYRFNDGVEKNVKGYFILLR